MAQPYRFYLLKRVQNLYASLNEAEKTDIDGLLTACDMRDVLEIELSREIDVKNNREVWS